MLARSVPGRGTTDAYANLRPVLTRPIDWTLIRRHYDQIVKYATALRLGTADAESIFKRFSRGSSGGAPMHPTYRALVELGKRRGADLDLIMGTLRHASLSTTGRYLHADPSDSSAMYLGL